MKVELKKLLAILRGQPAVSAPDGTFAFTLMWICLWKMTYTWNRPIPNRNK
jgi:hypothetical protein